MTESLFSKFTPSLMSPEALEAIFVQREKLLARLIELVTQDSNSSGKHHSLMVGARGIGKTFLMSILYHRISVMPELKTKAVIAWLKEEEWGVTSYAEFIISILKAMDSEKDATFDEEMDSLYNLDPNAAEKKAEELLEKTAGDRMVLLLAENMDMIFEDIKQEGQRKLRAFLQETSSISIIATSQSLFDGVSRQTSPFYGSFHIHHLESLTLDESLTLLEKIARFRHDERLAEYIKTRAARARIRAVIHLSGGNHRVMAIFSQFLTYDTLEDLVSPFMAMIDELTPYYQSKMKELPAQQRKIVDYLCGKRGAAQVKEIARKSFMSHQASSSQLKILREKGYVVSKAIGRDSYYELAEPLMRLCVEVKMHNSEPVRLLIDMLRIWYSTEDLEKRIDFHKDKSRSIDFEYACKALDLNKNYPDQDPVYVTCREQFSTYFSHGDLAKAQDVLEDLRAARPGASEKILCDFPQYDEYIGILAKCLELLNNKKYNDAVEILDQATDMKPEDESAWEAKGTVLYELGLYKEALEAISHAFRLKPKYNFHICMITGKILNRLNRIDESLEFFLQASKQNPKDLDCWKEIGGAYGDLGKFDKALDAFNMACKINPEASDCWLIKGSILEELCRHEEALDAFNHAHKLNPKDDISLYAIGLSHYWNKCFKELSELPVTIDTPNMYKSAYIKGHGLIAVGKWDESIAFIEKSLSEMDLKKDGDIILPSIISSLLYDHYNFNVWPDKASELSRLFKKFNVLDFLSANVLNSLDKLLSPMASLAMANEWLTAWERAAGEDAEFGITLNIMRTVLKYKEKPGDERVFMELPAEERIILKQLIKKSVRPTVHSRQAKGKNQFFCPNGATA
ncbi:MAG: tetratricopeptide repeat protein [Desulfobacteraceae bacterium]